MSVESAGSAVTTRVAHQDAQPPAEDAFAQVTPRKVGRVAAWLDGQEWYRDPQPAMSMLVREAKEGDWTTSYRVRYARVAWLYLVAVHARFPLWLIVRLWIGGETPPFGAQGISCCELVDHARVGGLRGKVFAAVAVPARLVSHLADSGARSAVAALFVWLWCNAVGWPQVVCVDYWWSLLSGFDGSGVSGIARNGALIAIVVAGVGWMAFVWLKEILGKGKGSS